MSYDLGKWEMISFQRALNEEFPPIKTPFYREVGNGLPRSSLKIQETAKKKGGVMKILCVNSPKAMSGMRQSMKRVDLWEISPLEEKSPNTRTSLESMESDNLLGRSCGLVLLSFNTVLLCYSARVQ